MVTCLSSSKTSILNPDQIYTNTILDKRQILCTKKTRTLSAQTSIRKITSKIINKMSCTILDKIYTHNLQSFVSYVFHISSIKNT